MDGWFRFDDRSGWFAWIGLEWMVVDSLMIWMLESWTPLLQRQAQIGEVATLDDFGCIKIYSKFAGKNLGKVL